MTKLTMTRTAYRAVLRRERTRAIESYKRTQKKYASNAPLPDFVTFVAAAAKSAAGFSQKSGWPKIAKFSADLPIAQREVMIAGLRKLICDAERMITSPLQAPPPKSINDNRDRRPRGSMGGQPRRTNMTLTFVKPAEIRDIHLGREAADAGVDIGELCRWPSGEYLAGYYEKKYDNHRLGYVLAYAHLECDPFKLREVVAAIRALPESAITALYVALMTDYSNLGQSRD